MQSSTGLWEALFCLYPFCCQREDDTETIINALIRLIIYFPSVIFKSSQFNCVKITICSPQKVTKMVSFRAFVCLFSALTGREKQNLSSGLCTKVIFCIIWICLASDFSHIFVLTSEHNGTLKYLTLEGTIWLLPGTGDTAVHCWTLQAIIFFSLNACIYHMHIYFPLFLFIKVPKGKTSCSW